jgi:hypothetical protein
MQTGSDSQDHHHHHHRHLPPPHHHQMTQMAEVAQTVLVLLQKHHQVTEDEMNSVNKAEKRQVNLEAKEPILSEMEVMMAA